MKFFALAAIMATLGTQSFAQTCGDICTEEFWETATSQDVDFHAEVTQVFHRELTHLEVMFRGSVLGQDIIVLPLFSSCYDGTGFEAEAVISGLQDVAAVG